VGCRLAAGTREITLVGQNVNSYLHDGLDFAGLIEQVAGLGVPRIRFTTNHPKDFSPALAKVMAELPNVCPALHLPAQSGSDSVLERMGRGYTNSQYRAKVEMARETVPGLGLTTDLMVGFPGESEDDFADTLRLVEDIRFDSAFLFNYNQRPGTRAAEWNDDVPPAVKQARLQVLIDKQAEITREINRSMVGRVEEVLVEGRARKEGLRGKLRRGTVINWQGEAIPGALCMVRVTAGDGHTLRGELATT
jgi:tRNA-2-methylthio-N6-dimethylallyladenosine synthase